LRPICGGRLETGAGRNDDTNPLSNPWCGPRLRQRARLTRELLAHRSASRRSGTVITRMGAVGSGGRVASRAPAVPRAQKGLKGFYHSNRSPLSGQISVLRRKPIRESTLVALSRASIVCQRRHAGPTDCEFRGRGGRHQACFGRRPGHGSDGTRRRAARAAGWGACARFHFSLPRADR
jgi:hypothetical protein